MTQPKNMLRLQNISEPFSSGLCIPPTFQVYAYVESLLLRQTMQQVARINEKKEIANNNRVIYK